MTTSASVGDSVIIAGRPERVAAARAFAAALLGGQHPQRDTVVLLVSELVTNSLRHSESARAGETVRVSFTRLDGMLRVAVTDRSGTSVPVRRVGEAGAEGGRGLDLVQALAARWGVDRVEGGTTTTTWFEVRDR